MAKVNASPVDLARAVFDRLKANSRSVAQPPFEVLEEIFHTLFYTSLKTEEDQFNKVTITLIDPGDPDPDPPGENRLDRWAAIHFKKPVLFSANNLVKLAKAADTWSSSLAIYFNQDNQLSIWGMIDQAIHSQNYLYHEQDSSPDQPGLFQATINGIGNILVMMNYELVASLKHDILVSQFIDIFRRGEVSDQVKQLTAPLSASLRRFIRIHHAAADTKTWSKDLEKLVANSLSRILLKIQQYRHGGSLLIADIPEDDDQIHVKYPINYTRLKKAFLNHAKHSISAEGYTSTIHMEYAEADAEDMPFLLHLNQSVSDIKRTEAKSELKGVIRYISSLTCVDGLVLMNRSFSVTGFGCIVNEIKILPRFVYVSTASSIKISNLKASNPRNYGTRHQSMFSFCWRNSGSLGFVISQDGDVRAIMRVGRRLVMWENIRIQNYARRLVPAQKSRRHSS